MKWTHFKKQSFIYITALLFILSITLHWTFSWKAYQNEQRQEGHAPDSSEWLTEVIRDTMENWQSEFLQLIWQVSGLAFLYCVGSSQSKEGDERIEEKIDHLIRTVDEQGEKKIRQLDNKYPRSN